MRECQDLDPKKKTGGLEKMRMPGSGPREEDQRPGKPENARENGRPSDRTGSGPREEDRKPGKPENARENGRPSDQTGSRPREEDWRHNNPRNTRGKYWPSDQTRSGPQEEDWRPDNLGMQGKIGQVQHKNPKSSPAKGPAPMLGGGQGP